MAKQTAVEWLVEQYNSSYTLEISDIEKAKTMEKEQIKEAYREGRTDQQTRIAKWYNRNAEYYYNKTYGGSKDV